MLKPCKIVTRGTATGLFFAALPNLQSRRTTNAWHDACHVHHDFRAPNFERHGLPDLRHVSAAAAALYVRTVGVDRIVEALVCSARLHRDGPDALHRILKAKCAKVLQRGGTRLDHIGVAELAEAVGPGVVAQLNDEHESLYGIPPEVIPFANDGHVLADKLLSLGHWVGESYSMWINRPKGTSRAKWQRAAALKFVQALPVPAEMYAMRCEPSTLDMKATPRFSLTSISIAVERMLPNGTRDALLLARTVEDAMLELYGCSFRFTLHAFSDTQWGVTISGAADPSTFGVSAPPEVIDQETLDGMTTEQLAELQRLINDGLLTREDARELIDAMLHGY